MNPAEPNIEREKLPAVVPPVLLCFGDSITADGRWVTSPEAAGAWQLVNAGRGGRKTSDIPTEFPEALAGHPEAAGVLIMLGVNDLPARDPRPGDEKISSCLANLQTAIDLALEHFHPRAIILAAPPNIDAPSLDSINQEKGYATVPSLLEKLEAGLQQLAEANGVSFISLHGVLQPGQFSDGLHPNTDGDAVIARTLGEKLPPPRAEFLAGPLPAFYVIGDSISIDYHEALEGACRGAYRYSRKGGLELARSDLDHPQGANGGDSQAVLEHLREVLTEPSSLPETLLVNCGLHDLKVDPATGQPQVSLEAYRQNLAEIAELVQQSGRRLVWITTTPVDEERHNARSKAFHRYERDLAAYNAAAVDVMTSQNVAVIDLHAFTMSLGDPIFRDHVHFLPGVSTAQASFLRSFLDTFLVEGRFSKLPD